MGDRVLVELPLLAKVAETGLQTIREGVEHDRTVYARVCAGRARSWVSREAPRPGAPPRRRTPGRSGRSRPCEGDEDHRQRDEQDRERAQRFPPSSLRIAGGA